MNASFRYSAVTPIKTMGKIRIFNTRDLGGGIYHNASIAFWVFVSSRADPWKPLAFGHSPYDIIAEGLCLGEC